MDRKVLASVLMMLTAASLWGFSGFFSRSIMDAGYTAFEVTSVRSVLSLVFLFIILLIFRREDLRIKRRDILFFVFFGVMKLASDLFLFMSQSSADLALSTTLQMMSPVYVVIITVVLYNVSISKLKITGLVLSVIGCVLVTGVLFDSDVKSTAGIVTGMLSGLFYGIYTLGAKMSLIRGYSAASTLFWMFVVPAVASFVLANPVPLLSASTGDPELLLLVLGLTVLITLLPYWLQTYSMRNLNVDYANVIGVMEAVVAVMVGYAIYSEGLTALNIVGMILIFAAIFIIGRDRAYRKNEGN